MLYSTGRFTEKKFVCFGVTLSNTGNFMVYQEQIEYEMYAIVDGQIFKKNNHISNDGHVPFIYHHTGHLPSYSIDLEFHDSEFSAELFESKILTTNSTVSLIIDIMSRGAQRVIR